MAPTLTLNISPSGFSLPVSAYPAGGVYGAPLHESFRQYLRDEAVAVPEGFGPGAHYMLATDGPGGPVIVEPGPGTRVFYFTASGSGATPASIAAAEGLTAPEITDAWVAGQARWGATEAEPLDWVSFGYGPVAEWVNGAGAWQSPWVLFERGHTYTGINPPDNRRLSGYSALHPTLYGAWGTGAKPYLNGQIAWSGGGDMEDGLWRRNIVFQGLRADSWSGTWLLRDLMITDFEVNGPFDNYGIVYDGVKYSGTPPDLVTLYDQPSIWGLSMYRGRVIDRHRLVPAQPGWVSTLDDRVSGCYTNLIRGLLGELVFWDANGFALDYAPDGSGTQPPTIFNHDWYCSESCGDVSVIGNIMARASLSAMQCRSGGHLLNNIYTENSVGHQINVSYLQINTIHQEIDCALIGGSVKATDPAIPNGTSAANPRGIEATSASNEATGVVTTPFSVVDGLIIANAADPLNAAEVAEKAGITPAPGGIPLANGLSHSHDFKCYGWFQTPDHNIAGIPTADLDEVTLGQWLDAEQSVTPGTNTTADALTWLRAQAEPWSHARPIWEYAATRFQTPFSTRAAPAYITFRPWQVGDGFRWDNPRNWSTNDLPGVDVAGDFVNLDGHRVHVCKGLVALSELYLGNGGGQLHVKGGKLRADSLGGVGQITIERAGQLWLGAVTSGSKTVRVSDGRLSFTGDLSDNLTIFVQGRPTTEPWTPIPYLGESTTAGFNPPDIPEVLIPEGRSITIGAGETWALTGAEAFVIFDGTGGGAATLTVAGTLAIDCTGGVPTIAEQRSGFYGLVPGGQPRDPNVVSTVVLASGSMVTVDTTGLSSGTYTLIEVDSLTDNGATLPAGVAVNGDRLEVTVP